MGLEVLFLLSVAVFLPFVCAGFAFTFWRKAAQQRGVAQAWRSYAARARFDFDPPAGTWPMVSSAVVRGDTDAGPFRIELLGTHEQTRTLLTLRREPMRLGEFALDAGGACVHQRPTGFASPLASPGFLRVYRAFALERSTELRYLRGAIELEWPGGELSAARLDEARAVATQAALMLDAASPGAPIETSD